MAFVNGWYLLRASIYIWALERIRQIGTALLRFEPISTEVAEAVRRSAQALLLCGLSTLLAFDIASNARGIVPTDAITYRSEAHPSELQSLMRISYAVFCLKKKNKHNQF